MSLGTCFTPGCGYPAYLQIWDGPYWYIYPVAIAVICILALGMVYVWSFRSVRIGTLLAAFVGSSLLLTGCPETPATSLHKQVREAGQASGYVNAPGADEPADVEREAH